MSLAAPLAFTMLQRTRVSKGSSVFWGNASLDGQLSHLLEGFNVTQVLPLEPPDAWARRQQDVATYLVYFGQLVKLFSMERPINCEWYLWGTQGRGRMAWWGDRSRWGRGPPPCTTWARGWLFKGLLGKGTGTRLPAKPCSGQKEPFCRAGNCGAHAGSREMLNLLLPLGKRAGGCSLGGSVEVWAPCLHPTCIPPALCLHPAAFAGC